VDHPQWVCRAKMRLMVALPAEIRGKCWRHAMTRRRLASGLATLASVAFVFAWSAAPAMAHDIYTDLRDRGGYRCCDGDDCEAVGSDFVILPDGGALLMSRKQGRWVRIAREKITFMVLKGGESSEAHWCGRRRSVHERG